MEYVCANVMQLQKKQFDFRMPWLAYRVNVADVIVI